MRRRAIAMLFLTTVLWGLSFVTMRSMGMIQSRAAPGIDSLPLASITVTARYALAALVVLLIWRGRGGLTRKEITQGAGLGIFHGLGLFLQTDGLAHTNASVSAFLTQGYCILLPLYFAIRTRTRPDHRTTISVITMMTGIALLANIDWQALHIGRGEFETLLCSILFAAQILWLERPVYRGNRYQPVTLIMFATVALVLLPVILVQAPGLALIANVLAPPSIWFLMTILVLFCTVAANLLMNRWQQHVTATEAGLIYGTEPVYACLIALFAPSLISSFCGIEYPNEHLTQNLLIGGGLIFAANVLMQWKRT